MTLGATIEDFQYSYTTDDEIKAITSLASATKLPVAKTVAPADASNRVSQFGNASYGFDAQGQTTSKTDGNGTTNYSWDARGRLTTASLPNGQQVSYGYDGLGESVFHAGSTFGLPAKTVISEKVVNLPRFSIVQFLQPSDWLMRQ